MVMDDAEIITASLAKAICPLIIKPDGFCHHTPIDRALKDSIPKTAPKDIQSLALRSSSFLLIPYR
jgi:hypothetical protein